ncbi:hypothetical protein Bca101_032583 [Brassica carinata]
MLYLAPDSDAKTIKLYRAPLMDIGNNELPSTIHECTANPGAQLEPLPGTSPHHMGQLNGSTSSSNTSGSPTMSRSSLAYTILNQWRQT